MLMRTTRIINKLSGSQRNIVKEARLAGKNNFSGRGKGMRMDDGRGENDENSLYMPMYEVMEK